MSGIYGIYHGKMMYSNDSITNVQTINDHKQALLASSMNMTQLPHLGTDAILYNSS